MPNVLRTATPMGDWRSFKFICPDSGGWYGAKNAFRNGQPWLYQVGDSVGFLQEDTDFGDKGVLCYHAEKVIVAKESGVMPVGAVVYWDPTSRLAGPTYQSTRYRIGIVTEPALSADTLVEIDLDGAGAAVRP